MVWFYVDDGLTFHTKTVHAGNAAMGLWVRAGAWATASLTDGYIPATIARSIGTPQQIAALVRSGLWSECSGGYSFHDWDHRQLTKAEVEQKRKNDRARKAEQRKARNVPPGRPAGHHTGIQTESTQDTPMEASRALPRACAPHPTPPSFGGDVGNATHHSTEPPPPYCPKHMPAGTNDPCHACGEARQLRKQFDADQHQRVVIARATRAAEILDCPDCDDKGWIETDDGVDRCPKHDWTMP